MRSGRRGRRGSVRFTSHHFISARFSQEQFSFPTPVGYVCLSSVFCFFLFVVYQKQTCLSHQRDLHLLRLVALLLLSAGVLFGWRRSRSHRS